MNIIFLVFHGLSECSGISKKIHYQIKGLQASGHKVYLCTYMILKNGHRVRLMDQDIIADYGKGKYAAIKKRVCYDCIYQYAISHQIDFTYVRSFHNANPFTINLFKKLQKAGIKIVMEIPTYPYDLEYVGFPIITQICLKIDKLFRKQLCKHINAVVTFSNYDHIFNQRTIQISNGIDFEAVPLKTNLINRTKELHLIGVAEVHYWHGYDRLIHGIGEYYQRLHEVDVFFHIVGGVGPTEMYNSQHAPGFYELIEKYKIEKQIIFHGQLFGTDLDTLFDSCHFAIGSLARHRSHIDQIKTLKNREYAARGIPFLYSETDSDFDSKPYVLKVEANETPIPVEAVITFYKTLQYSSKEIRDSIKQLSWKEQMHTVTESI